MVKYNIMLRTLGVAGDEFLVDLFCFSPVSTWWSEIKVLVRVVNGHVASLDDLGLDLDLGSVSTCKKHMLEMVITYCFGLDHNKNFQK